MLLTREQLAEFEAEFARRPDRQRWRELVVEEATRRGGLTLAFWRRFRGVYWGEPAFMSLEECSKELRVPVSDLTELGDDVLKTVRRRWMASQEDGSRDLR